MQTHTSSALELLSVRFLGMSRVSTLAFAFGLALSPLLPPPLNLDDKDMTALLTLRDRFCFLFESGEVVCAGAETPSPELFRCPVMHESQQTKNTITTLEKAHLLEDWVKAKRANA